jgi:TPR repeat protein
MKIGRPSRFVLCISFAAVVLTGLAIWFFFFYEEEHWLNVDRDDFLKLERLAKAGNGEACFCLSEYYLKIPKENDYWLMKAAIHGDKQAQSIMFTILKRDTKTIGQAIEFLKHSARQNNGFAQFELGQEYEAGAILPRDLKQAEYWYRKAVQNGATSAGYNLAKLLAETRRDASGLTEAYKCLAMEEERTDPGAAGYLGLIQKQKTLIIKKASSLGYDGKYLVRQAKHMAAIEAKDFIKADISTSLDERCKRLANSPTAAEK